MTWVPTIDQVWTLIALVVPVLGVLKAMATIDLAYHIRAGELILARGIPRFDTFTFTADGQPWLDQQWGSQVILATVHRMGGWRGLIVLRAMLTFATFLPVWFACRARGSSNRTAALLTLGAFLLALTNLGMRPQLLALPLFTMTVWFVLDRRGHPGRLWCIPIMAMVWSNLHGTFPLALAAVALALIEDLCRREPLARKTLAVALATLAATFINPFGWDAWRYAGGVAESARIRDSVQEWAATNVRDVTGLLFFVSAVAVAFFLARQRKPVDWPSLMWLGAFFVLALPVVRGVVWWALVAPPIVAGILAGEGGPARGRSDRSALGVVVIASLVGLLFLLAPWGTGPNRQSGSAPQLAQAPQNLVVATQAALAPTARLFVTQPFASWFEFSSPSNPVFVDSRIELFPEDVWNDYLDVMNGREGWEQILDRWRIDAVVLSTDDTTIGSLLDMEAGWRRTYRDAMGTVYVRVSPL